MPLTFQQCRSCGGKTPVDTSAAEPEEYCIHCGGRWNEIPDEWQSKPKRISEERIAELKASGYQPQNRSLMDCPRCKAMTPVEDGRPLHKQRCMECGSRLGSRPGKVRKRKKSKSFVDGMQIRRSRERVWMPMLGAMLIVVMAVIFGIWMNSRPKPDSAEQEPPAPPPPRFDVKELTAKFMAAKTPEELLPLLRKPVVFEKAVREWCAARPGALPMEGELLSITAPRTALGTRLVNADILFKRVPRAKVLTVETPEGWRVEWPAFTGIADLSVEDFLKKRPDVPVTVLVNARRSDYYNNAYSDEEKWMALRVSDRLDEKPFYVYAKRGDEGLIKSLEVLPPGDAPARGQATFYASRRMALRLHFVHPPGEGAPQAQLALVVGDGWYIP
jgi:hypothetical protein